MKRMILTLFTICRLEATPQCPIELLTESTLPPEKIYHRIFKPMVIGKTPPQTIVLIHGIDSSWEVFLPLIPELTQRGYRVLAYDQRGHGRTPPLGKVYSSNVMARDLKVLLAHLKIEKPHLLGLSFGAKTAMAFAELYPNNANAIIVEDMELLGRSQRSERRDLEVQALARRKRLKQRRFGSREAIIQALIKAGYTDYHAQAIVDKHAVEEIIKGGGTTYQLSYRPDVLLRYGYRVNSEDFSETLRNMPQPLLVLRADLRLGSAITESGIQHIYENRPGTDIETIAKAPHCMHETQDNAEKVATLVDAFLSAGGKIPPGFVGKYR